MKKILICGYGNIGRYITEELAYCGYELFVYDPQLPQSKKEQLDESYDFVFVCVPTDKKEDGSADTSIVEEVLNSLINTETIVLKSTVPLGFCESCNMKNLVFSPEYYGTTIHSPNSPNFLVLGGNKEYCDKVAELYHEVKTKDFKITFTDYKTAELAKYMENCFLATKITFCSEFYDICKNEGISYNELREIFVLDERMGNSHTYINSNHPYYDSHCLNKDIPALIHSCKIKGIEIPFMNNVYKINEERKERNGKH